MGAKIEYDMRAEIFAHFQKLSFSFYDDQKVGQLMSRITTDLFDITELMHHGPENIILSLIKIIGAFVILMSIKPIALRIMNPELYKEVEILSKEQDLSLNMTINMLLGFSFNEIAKQNKKFEKKVVFELK